MNIEIFTFCESASENGGRLNIVGTFDAFTSSGFPVVTPSCALAIRVRFDRHEKGDHNLKVLFVDADGKEIIPPYEMSLNVKVPPGQSTGSFSFPILFQGIKFERSGEYVANMEIDGQNLGYIPLIVK